LPPEARIQDIPDGSKLAVGVGSNLIEIWDLGLIHRNLAEIGLGWRPEMNAH